MMRAMHAELDEIAGTRTCPKDRRPTIIAAVES
jgi:hypothetical protein